MKPKTPEIGIALAVYEPRADYLHEQLESLRNQTFQNWICVLSFDSDLDAIQSDPLFAHFVNDERFLWHKNPVRLGHTKNFETAARLVLEKYPGLQSIAFCDQDDIWYSNKLETLRRSLKALPSLSGVHSNMDLLFPDGNKLPGFEYEGRKVAGFRLFDLALRNICTGASSLFDANLIAHFPEIPNQIQDYDHWFALLAFIKGNLIAIETPLYAYRQHSANVIGAQAKAGLLSTRRKWTFRKFISHCMEIDQGFEVRVNSLPLSAQERRRLISTSCLLLSFVRNLSNRNWMVARLCIARLIATLVKRA